MLYTGFTQKELKEITGILDRFQVSYEISTHHESLKQAEDTVTHPHYHHHANVAVIDNSFYAITIDQAALKALPGSELLFLQEKRIFPEMDTAYHHEEIITPPVQKKKTSLSAKSEKVMAWIGLLFFAYMGLVWIDDYVYPIFNFISSIELF